MKVVILAGGFGTRISEESHLRPKPMIEIGGKPILWHIMKGYSYYGYNEFIICAGYKQQVIKEWFADYYLYNSDVTFDFASGGDMTIHNNISEPWKVTVIDTGYGTMTGGRVKRIQPYIGNETFMLTYGDGVADIDIKRLEEFHRAHGKAATLSAVQVRQRFGTLEIGAGDDAVLAFREKALMDSARINGGYMVLEPDVFRYIEGDDTVLEKEPLSRLAQAGQLAAYRHDGFWKCMDTQRERDQLERMVVEKNAPWMLWEQPSW